mgnify:CR=1 FL=1
MSRPSSHASMRLPRSCRSTGSACRRSAASPAARSATSSPRTSSGRRSRWCAESPSRSGAHSATRRPQPDGRSSTPEAGSTQPSIRGKPRTTRHPHPAVGGTLQAPAVSCAPQTPNRRPQPDGRNPTPAISSAPHAGRPPAARYVQQAARNQPHAAITSASQTKTGPPRRTGLGGPEGSSGVPLSAYRCFFERA